MAGREPACGASQGRGRLANRPLLHRGCYSAGQCLFQLCQDLILGLDRRHKTLGAFAHATHRRRVAL